MLSWLVMTALTSPTALPAGPGLPPAMTEIEAPAPRSVVNLRLVRQPAFEPERVRRFGVIVETSVAPNAAIGLGLLKVSKRSAGAVDLKSDGRKPKRNVGLSFHLQF